MLSVPSASPNHVKKDKMACVQQLLGDLLLGSFIATLVTTATAPFHRANLLYLIYQSQIEPFKSQSEFISGKIKTLSRAEHFKCTRADHGLRFFWRGNLANCLRYAPQQGCALAFNDALNDVLPYYSANTDFWKSLGAKLLSGGLAGAIATTFCFPFNFALQRRTMAKFDARIKFEGIADCILSTAKAQGITGLYAGWSIAVAGAFVYRAGQLGCFKQLQDMSPYKNDTGALGAISALAAVTAARTVVVPFSFPFDTVRRRMALQSEKPPSERLYKGSVDCFVRVLRGEGVRGMYKGLVPELARGVGGSLVVVAYDRVKTMRGGYS